MHVLLITYKALEAGLFLFIRSAILSDHITGTELSIIHLSFVGGSLRCNDLFVHQDGIRTSTPLILRFLSE